MKRRRQDGAALVLVVLCAAMVGAGIFLMTRPSHAARMVEPPAAPLPSRTYSVPPASLPKVAVPVVKLGKKAPGAQQACDTSVASSRIVIPDVCINGPIVPTIRLATGALVIPDDVRQVGVWDAGAGLDDKAGTTLMAGHVSYAGRGDGTFYNLYGVKPGDAIYVADAQGRVTRWRVVSLDVVVKAKLPTSVFAGRSGPRRLVMVTCGGPIDEIAGYGRSFRDNVVATAVPA